VRGNSHARLCVQVRLLCPAGVSPVGVTIGSPVAGWQAGGKPNDLKPIDNPIFGMGASRRAVTTVNARWPRQGRSGGRARNREGEGSTARRRPIDAMGRSGGVVSDSTATRTQLATGEALLVPTGNGGSWVSPITGSTGKWADDERVTDGSVVASKRGNARGAKGPCCSAIPSPTREAGVR